MLNKFQTLYKFCFKFIFLINLLHLPPCYSLNVRNGQKWPNGVVIYKLDETFTLEDISEFKKSFEDYHTRTCIRFKPWKEGNPDYVSLEANNVNNAKCGRGHYCKIGGYQWARFSDECRHMGFFSNMLGYALCLTKENLRADSDKYLNYADNCNETPTAKDLTAIQSGIYDYSSVFHDICNNCVTGWPKPYNLSTCGRLSSSSELTVLDVDGINALYNCEDCHRHRWIPVESLTHEHKTNMHSFGYTSSDGSPLYPCRAVYNGEVTLGSLNVSTKSCHVSYSLKAYEVMNNVEVLTIPGGLEANCNVYKLVNRENTILKSAVTAGASFASRRWRGYIAYGSITKTGGKMENAVGKVWVLNPENSPDDPENNFPNRSAELTVGSESYSVANYKVLTCSKDMECMMEKIYLDRIK